ncbi:MAG: Stp1/IreP family PP2C-type Ser/Thr phosphatase [Myxococcota bacterium]
MNFVAAGLSDVGLQREVNEDSFCILPNHRLFIVADGMGGHRAGDVASKMATRSISSFFQETTELDDSTWPFHFDPHLTIDENRLVAGIKLANRQIFDASTKDREVHGMGTTVVGALYSREQRRLYVAHVGDSRAYRIRKGEIKLLTRDHSLINDYLLVMPDMTDEQMEELPKNVITRALGMQDSVAVDLAPDEPEQGDVYVLCSDGLSGMVSDQDIARVVRSTGDDPEQTAKELVRQANENGGEDNVTVVVLQFLSSGREQPQEDETTQEIPDPRFAETTAMKAVRFEDEDPSVSSSDFKG